jgi:hypothetical protein
MNLLLGNNDIYQLLKFYIIKKPSIFILKVNFVTQAFQSSNILNDFKIILECKISFKNKTHNI